MEHTLSGRYLSVAALATLAALALTSCSRKDSPTAPASGVTTPTIRGSVEFPNHSAAPDVFVWIEPNLAYGFVDLSSVEGIATTDSTGAFGMYDIPAGHFFVFAGISRGLPILPNLSDSLVAALPVQVYSPTTAAPAVHLTLGQPGVFTGRVVEDVTGRPANALVTTLGALAFTATDTNGFFELPGVAPGSWPVVAVEYIDSVTVLFGDVTGVIPAPGARVTLPDIRVLLSQPPLAARPMLDRMAALRERRTALLHRIEARR
jgi:hypothetical protein